MYLLQCFIFDEVSAFNFNFFSTTGFFFCFLPANAAEKLGAIFVVNIR